MNYETFEDGQQSERKRILELIDKQEVISKHSYVRAYSNKILLIKYLIDKEALKKEIGEKK